VHFKRKIKIYTINQWFSNKDNHLSFELKAGINNIIRKQIKRNNKNIINYCFEFKPKMIKFGFSEKLHRVNRLFFLVYVYII